MLPSLRGVLLAAKASSISLLNSDVTTNSTCPEGCWSLLPLQAPVVVCGLLRQARQACLNPPPHLPQTPFVPMPPSKHCRTVTPKKVLGQLRCVGACRSACLHTHRQPDGSWWKQLIFGWYIISLPPGRNLHISFFYVSKMYGQLIICWMTCVTQTNVFLFTNRENRRS